jgi:hypothetical protein
MDATPHSETEMMDVDSQSLPLSKLPTYLRVLDVLANLRRRDALSGLFSGGGRVLLFFVSVLLIRCTLDYWLHFSWAARAALLAADAVIVSWLFQRFIWKPFQRRLTRDGAALRLQAFAPELQSRMIATVQLVADADDGKASRSLVEKLLMDATLDLEQVDWQAAVPLKRPLAWFGAALFVASCGVAWALIYTPAARVLVPRYFLSTQAPILQTQLKVMTGDMRLSRGSDVVLSAVASGEVPREAVFELIDVDGSLQHVTVPIVAVEMGKFQLTIENTQQSFSYRVLAGDARSREFEVEVLDPPALRELSFEVTPPDYTGVAPYTTPASAFRLIEGASVVIAGIAAADLTAATVYFYPRDAKAGELNVGEGISLTVGSDNRILSGDVGGLSPEVGFISVHLMGSNGAESVNNTRYPIEWILDDEPEIILNVAPSDGAVIAAGRSVRVAGVVNEDYALGGLNFCYEVNRSEADEVRVLRTIPLEFSGMERAFDFSFSAGAGGIVEVEATTDTTIRWWIEATDNCTLADGAHVSETAHFTIGVVSSEEKIAQLMGSVRDSMSTLEEMGDSQIKAGERLKKLIDGADLVNGSDL